MTGIDFIEEAKDYDNLISGLKDLLVCKPSMSTASDNPPPAPTQYTQGNKRLRQSNSYQTLQPGYSNAIENSRKSSFSGVDRRLQQQQAQFTIDHYNSIGSALPTS